MMVGFSALPRRVMMRLVILASMVLSMAACDLAPSTGGSGQTIDASAPVPVALLIPKGAGSQDALVARSLENAARLAMADLDGVQIDLRVYDTAGNEAQAASAAGRAVAEGAKIILGPLYAQSANAAGVAAAPLNVNVLAFSNNPTIAGGNVFVLGNTFENTANRLVQYSKSQGKDSIFVIHAENVAERLGRDAILAAAQRAGVTVAGVGRFELSQQDLVQSIPRIAAEARSSGAEAVFMTSGSAGALPFLADLLPENGLSNAVAQYVGLQRLDIPAQALTIGGLQGSWFALPDPSVANSFQGRYNATYGEAPHPLAALAYDGIAAIGALVKSNGNDALTARSLTQKSGFVGVNGIFRFTPDGRNERALAIAQIQNNRVVVIDPAPTRFGRAGL